MNDCKSMERALAHFKKCWPEHEATLDELESYPGHWHIGITEPVCGLTAWYWFDSVRDFREWTDGVVL